MCIVGGHPVEAMGIMAAAVAVSRPWRVQTMSESTDLLSEFRTRILAVVAVVAVCHCGTGAVSQPEEGRVRWGISKPGRAADRSSR